MMSTPTILVLGATGKIGGPLVKELLPDHATGRLKLVAAVRRPEAARRFEESGIEARRFDLDAAEMQGLEPVARAMQILSQMRFEEKIFALKALI